MNVFVVFDDALRASRLGCYGNPNNTSPTCDRLASEGVRFESVCSVSTHTMPPIVSIITGQTTTTHGLMTAQDYDQWMYHELWKGRRSPLHLLEENGFLIDGDFVSRCRFGTGLLLV